SVPSGTVTGGSVTPGTVTGGSVPPPGTVTGGSSTSPVGGSVVVVIPLPTTPMPPSTPPAGVPAGAEVPPDAAVADAPAGVVVSGVDDADDAPDAFDEPECSEWAGERGASCPSSGLGRSMPTCDTSDEICR